MQIPRSEQEYQEQSWHDNGDALDDAKYRLIKDLKDGDSDAEEMITDVLAEIREQRETSGDPHIPYTDAQLLKAITINSDSGWNGDHDEVGFDDTALQEPDNLPSPDQLSFAGIPEPERAGMLTKDMREQIASQVLAAFQTKAQDLSENMEAPDMSDMVNESLDGAWDIMDDGAK